MPSAPVMIPAVHVAAAVLEDSQGRILLARRGNGRDLAGAWEFPGGKLEPGESAEQALCRELDEELGIHVAPDACTPFIRVPCAYAHKRIALDVYRVRHWEGRPRGRERQALAWTPPHKLAEYDMPAADRPVVAALLQPDRYLITPVEPTSLRVFANALEDALASGIRRVQLRMPGLGAAELSERAVLARAICAEHGASLLINADIAMAQRLGVGVHLRGAQLPTLHERPLPADVPVAASCHDAAELRQAQALGVDFVALGPLKPTPSHPGQSGIGWSAFAGLREATELPIYAIGGLRMDDLGVARQHGAQGIAAIRGLWPGDL